jgi:hypothetical protein
LDNVNRLVAPWIESAAEFEVPQTLARSA